MLANRSLLGNRISLNSQAHIEKNQAVKRRHHPQKLVRRSETIVNQLAQPCAHPIVSTEIPCRIKPDPIMGVAYYEALQHIVLVVISLANSQKVTLLS